MKTKNLSILNTLCLLYSQWSPRCIINHGTEEISKLTNDETIGIMVSKTVVRRPFPPSSKRYQ